VFQIYEYEQLKITNEALPPDTEINTLEVGGMCGTKTSLLGKY
jgi:hypothetical protein